MTYNFDPDQWYENQLRLLTQRLESGEIDEAQHRSAVDEIDRRYEEMVRRLDGTYCIPENPR